MAVQVSAVDDAAELVAQGNTELRGQAPEDPCHRFPPVHVLVGVQMGGLAAGQRAKPGKLALHLRLHGLRVALDRHDLVHRCPCAVLLHPLAEVDVQAHSERRRGAGVGGGLFGRLLADHQAGAGQDALLVRARDACVHARAEAEVVRVDYQGAFRHQPGSLEARVARRA